MSDPALGLLMLGLIVVVIMMGFPTAFTLMGLGMFFGFIAFYDPTHLFTESDPVGASSLSISRMWSRQFSRDVWPDCIAWRKAI